MNGEIPIRLLDTDVGACQVEDILGRIEHGIAGWCASGESPVPPTPRVTAKARGVPSVVIPHERNFVLNPAHREFAQLSIGRSEPFSFNPRMWKK